MAGIGLNTFAFPGYKTGFWYLCNSPGNATTGATLGNNTARATPFILTRPVKIATIGGEFTIAGEANSILRLGFLNDDGTGLPGTVAIDAGSISTGTGNAGTVATGGTPNAYEIPVNKILPAGVYWATAAVQGAPSTQPTVRVVGSSSMVIPLAFASIPSSGAINTAYQMAGVSGALTTWSGSTSAGNGPRMFFKVG